MDREDMMSTDTGKNQHQNVKQSVLSHSLEDSALNLLQITTRNVMFASLYFVGFVWYLLMLMMWMRTARVQIIHLKWH